VRKSVFHMRISTSLRSCIIGAGPAGFYAAKYLLKALPNITVDIYEELPVPFGLVRYGVAPDHPQVKSVEKEFLRIASHERVQYFGNVKVGKDVPAKMLETAYDAVIYSTGASSDRNLGLPNEKNLRNIFTSRQFVNWYNGMPNYSKMLETLKDVNNVVIVGQGNVALDCARILAKSPNDFVQTDIAEYALGTLKDSAVKSISIVGRRGHVQAAFTTRELRELVNLQNVGVFMSAEDFEDGRCGASLIELKGQRSRQRMDKLLKGCTQQSTNRDVSDKSINLRFFLSPLELIPSEKDSSRIGSVRFDRACLKGDPGRQHAVLHGDGRREIIPCDLLISSLGYESVPIEGVPFDDENKVIPNNLGRVTEKGIVAPGIYCCGWVKRGPRGIVGSNILDAQETVSSIVHDVERGFIGSYDRVKGGSSALREMGMLSHSVNWDGFMKIHNYELQTGTSVYRRYRKKIVSVDEMIRLAKST
jgi:adrenodoxin-NADP+ reductase